MTTRLLALALLAGSSLFARTHVFVGIGIGGGYGYYPAAPPPVVVYAPPPPPPVYYTPPCPGPEYGWVSGYWYPAGPRYHWHAGFWARRPWAGARWERPHYRGHRYYHGRWRR